MLRLAARAPLMHHELVCDPTRHVGVVLYGSGTLLIARLPRCTPKKLRQRILPCRCSRLRFARCKLLVALREKLNQTVHAALLDLVAELLPIGLDEPNAENVQVIQTPPLRRLV